MPAAAGWVTIKNDTNKAIIVQEVVVANGRQMRGKPVKLLAGESFREFQNAVGAKCYEVFDFTHPNATLYSGHLPCGADSQTFAVRSVDGRIRLLLLADPRRP